MVRLHTALVARRAAVCLAIAFGCAGNASAHPSSLAFWRVTVGATEARSEIVVSLADVGGNRAPAMSAARREGIARDMLAHFVVEGSPAVPAELTGARILPSGSLEVTARHRLAEGSAQVRLRSTFHQVTDDSHRVLARIEHEGRVVQRVFDATTPGHDLPRTVTSAWYRSVVQPGSIGAMLLLGIEHILMGYDHLVFLGCLLLPGGTWRSRVAIVSAFTAAHSLTLVLSAMHVVAPPARFVEAAIALSVAYVAAENLLFPVQRSRWPTAFGFGLIHGFGFAGALNVLDLPLGRWLMSVFAFNLGVEIGQLLVIAAALPLVAVIHRTPWHRRLVRCTSILVIGLAGVWVLERIR